MTVPYLYQIVHLHACRPRNVCAHTALLAEAARSLFGLDWAPDTARLEARIAAVAAAERYPHAVSCFVRIELAADGRERLVPAGVSLYDGYALRSLRPDAVTLPYDLPLTEAPTSAREAAAGLARVAAGRKGAGGFVRCDSRGHLRAADDAPLFAVRGAALLAAPGPETVERTLCLEAAQIAGLHVVEQPLEAEDLAAFDELFYADHRGVTALGHCDGHPYMALAAQRIAAAMERLARSREK